MIESLITESGKVVLGYSVLGVYSIMVTLALIWAVKTIREESEGRRQDAEKLLTVAQSAIDLNERVINALDVRAKEEAQHAQTLIGLAQAFKHMVEMSELQTSRMLDKLDHMSRGG